MRVVGMYTGFTFSKSGRMMKTARSYLYLSGHNTGTWRNDGRTDRQS